MNVKFPVLVMNTRLVLTLMVVTHVSVSMDTLVMDVTVRVRVHLRVSISASKFIGDRYFTFLSMPPSVSGFIHF